MLNKLVKVTRSYAASVKESNAQVSAYTVRSIPVQHFAEDRLIEKVDFHNVRSNGGESSPNLKGYRPLFDSLTTVRRHELAYDVACCIGGFASVLDEFMSFAHGKFVELYGPGAVMADLFAIRARKGMVGGYALNKVNFGGLPYLCYDFNKDSILDPSLDQPVDLAVCDDDDCDVLTIDLFEVANIIREKLPYMEFPWKEFVLCAESVMKYLDSKSLLYEDMDSWSLHFNSEEAERHYSNGVFLVEDCDKISREIWKAAFDSGLISMWNHVVKFVTDNELLGSAANFKVIRVRNFL